MLLYGKLARVTLKTRWAYKANLVLDLTFQMGMLSAELAVLLLIASAVHGIAGWNGYQLVFLYGLNSLSAGFYRVFGSEFHNFDKYLVHGDFDTVLTRPAPTLLVISARSIDVEQSGMMLEGAILVIVAVGHLNLLARWGALTVTGEILGAVVAGSLIWYAIVIVLAALGFWVTHTDDLATIFLYGPETAAGYPLSIYPRAVRVLFSAVLPVAFGGYLPARVILHKGLGPEWLALSAGVAVVSMMVATGFWRLGVRHYTSTGT